MQNVDNSYMKVKPELCAGECNCIVQGRVTV